MGRGPAVILVDSAGNVIDVLTDGSAKRLQVSVKSALDIAAGLYTGASAFGGFGERSGIGTGTPGEDIWRGASVLVPTPADAGDAMSIVSASASDAAGGSGVRTVLVDYLDASGNPQTEAKTLNGATPVALADTAVRFVQKIYATTVGSGGVAAGDIAIHKNGAPSTVYNLIKAGGNMSLTPHRMVPLGKKLIVTSWHATESKDKRVAFKLRATAEDGTIRPGVFLFKDAIYLSKGALQATVLFALPALSIIKVSGWGDAAGGEASCSWEGVLVDA